MKILAVIGLLGLLIGCGDSQQPAESEVTDQVEASQTKAPETNSESTTSAVEGMPDPDSAELVSEKLVSEEPANSMVDKTDPNWKSNVPEPEMMKYSMSPFQNLKITYR